MNCNAGFVYSENYTTYRFHSEHPFNQKRLILTYDLLHQANALQPNNIIKPRFATDEELMLFHDSSYIEKIKRASTGNLTEQEGLEIGIGTEDTPIFPGMHDASSLIVGGSLQAVDAVLTDGYTHATNLGGGLHHGFKRKASGFCIYNDGAVAIQYIRKKYNLKVLYVDTDAHHGDGVQWAFYDDPNVCTLSIHETGRYLFPGTGNIHERGIKEGYGYSFNIPIDAFTEDESFLHVYKEAMTKIVDYFQPDIIVTQNGADAHAFDPLTHLCLTMSIYEQIPAIAHELAHQYCDGRWIALGGGGYDIWRVVPRAWAQIWQIMNAGTPFKGELPKVWLDKWSKESPVSLPRYWHDEPQLYKPIPRKDEITEKNQYMLTKALQLIRNKNNHHLNDIS
ncbi:acetoin utilization protein AcuC [Salirhabdus salicampi]|uniref:acetoin utilization protein AcuC n=1 Tax=Salirhabdus salicampi TaxID=476102 RepID=UPI0020C2DF08|nr:acetoin utilization protein AcuC [Salirhabdus salicampi]MCP8617141.1 acetoin utilization protein AcuC [Salirhabdus salicampi]